MAGDVLIAPTVGNVGIGTNAPDYKLHVEGGSSIAVYGQSTSSVGVSGSSSSDIGVVGASVSHVGVAGVSEFGTGVYGASESGNAGLFAGKVQVTGKVNIGTTTSGAKLHVQGGNVFIANPNSLVITSPNGACWQIRVSDAGALFAASVTCP